MSIAILGGTGKEGRGLAERWARAGRTVVIGSRDASRGQTAADELNEKLGSRLVSGASNHEAARLATVVVSTLPHAGHVAVLKETRDALEGKLLVTATIAWPPSLTGRPSAAEEIRDALGGSVRLAAAFQTVSAGSLRDPDHNDEDVLIFADRDEDAEEARALVDETGLRGILAGPIDNARVAEALTGVLLGVNKRYRVRSTGLRLTGLPDP